MFSLVFLLFPTVAYIYIYTHTKTHTHGGLNPQCTSWAGLLISLLLCRHLLCRFD